MINTEIIIKSININKPKYELSHCMKPGLSISACHTFVGQIVTKHCNHNIYIFFFKKTPQNYRH